MRCDEIDAAIFHSLPQRVPVVAAVGNNALGILARTTSSSRNSYFVERRFGEAGLGGTGRRKVHSERNTLAVDQYHELCPLTLACFSDARPPFLAGAKVPSMNASLQSSCAASSSCARNARHNSSHTSLRSHSPSRRQHVDGLGYSLGRSFHRAPVRRTQRIPSKHWRLSAGGRPPRLPGFHFGKCGSTLAHCSSVRRSIATVDHA
jgi:hypothetical protein